RCGGGGPRPPGKGAAGGGKGRGETVGGGGGGGGIRGPRGNWAVGRLPRPPTAMTALVFAAVITGCASSSEPPKAGVYVYPAQGQSAEQQAQDTGACQTWAQHQTGYNPTGDTAKGVGVGAALGALGGAALGAAVGAAAGSPGTGAALGGAGGGGGGAHYGGVWPRRP